jgi:hypothetical protein
MTNFKVPTSLKWIWGACLILLINMQLYRAVLISLFNSGWTFTEQAHVFFVGLGYDTCLVAFIGAIAMLLGLLPGKHPYKNRSGKRAILIYFSFIAALLLACNMVDLVFLSLFDRRPLFSDLNDLFGDTLIADKFWEDFPLLPSVVLILSILWAWWTILRFLHRQMAVKVNDKDAKGRKFWQITNGSVGAVLGILFFIQIREVPPNGETIYRQIQGSSLRFNTVQLLLKHGTKEVNP